MRKENSTFNMRFLSEPGAQSLHNNDYFGCSELDGFACYVVADGLQPGSNRSEDPSARLAVEAAIGAFNAAPSMNKGALKRYLTAAHEALVEVNGGQRCRASVTIVVTDYQKLRHGNAGNSRFNLYRNGKLIEESRDHSLSWAMMEKDQITKDKIATHNERNNLSSYCGIRRTFRPTISKAITLSSADIFTLYTRGIWENAQAADILSAINAAGSDPDEAAYYLERLILDKVPADGSSENYTICFVYADKTYEDPEQGMRKKKAILFTVAAVLAVVIIVIAITIYGNWRKRTLSDMQAAYSNGIEYIQGSNFIRAGEELRAAMELATKLRNDKHRSEISGYIMLIDAIRYADDLMESGSYELASDSYRAAANQSRYADNLAIAYIEARRERASDHINVHELIFLGDSLADAGDWEGAESRYLAARNIATRLHYQDGRTAANDALESLQRARQAEAEAQREAAVGQSRTELSAAELVIQGDAALRDGDYEAAALYYQLARSRYEELGHSDIVASIDRKARAIDTILSQNEQRLEDAIRYVEYGDEMVAQGEYFDAKRYYLLARDVFASTGEDERLRDVLTKIELVDLYMAAIAAQAETAPTDTVPSASAPPNGTTFIGIDDGTGNGNRGNSNVDNGMEVAPSGTGAGEEVRSDSSGGSPAPNHSQEAGDGSGLDGAGNEARNGSGGGGSGTASSDTGNGTDSGTGNGASSGTGSGADSGTGNGAGSGSGSGTGSGSVSDADSGAEQAEEQQRLPISAEEPEGYGKPASEEPETVIEPETVKEPETVIEPEEDESSDSEAPGKGKETQGLQVEYA